MYASLNWVIIGSENGLSPVRRQATIWTNAGILLIGPLGTNFSEILIGIQTFSFKKLHLKTSSAKWRLFCLGLNELMHKWLLLLNLFQSTCLLIYNSQRTAYDSMNSWKYCMKTLTHIDSWCKIQPGSNWWAFVNGISVSYTVVYRVFVEN